MPAAALSAAAAAAQSLTVAAAEWAEAEVEVTLEELAALEPVEEQAGTLVERADLAAAVAPVTLVAAALPAGEPGREHLQLAQLAVAEEAAWGAPSSIMKGR